MTDFIDRVILRMSGSLPTIQSPIDAVKRIWWFQDGNWAPQGFNDLLATDNSYLTLTNYSNNPPDTPLNLFAYTIQGSGGEPVLTIDRGITVQKDITAGGFVGSNQGELWLGSSRNDQVDTPKIILMRSDTSRLLGGGSLSVPPVPSGPSFPTGVKGKVAVLTVAWNGNPANTLYKHDGTNWNPMGPTTNYAGSFDTLYLTKSDCSTPAHLDMGRLRVIGGDSAGPGVWFSSAGPSGYFGNSLGVGLNSAYAIVLNAGGGGVVTAVSGSPNNTLDDGSGNMWISGSWLHSSNTLYIGGASGAAVTMYMNGNVNPISDNAYGLGSGSNRWQGISALTGYFGDLNNTTSLALALQCAWTNTNAPYGIVRWQNSVGGIDAQIDCRTPDGNRINMYFGHFYNAGYTSNDLMILDSTGNLTLTTGNFYSPNAANSTGGTYIDTWGNLKFNGGSASNNWNVFCSAGPSILSIPNATGNSYSATIASNLNPATDNYYGLGSGSNRWAGLTCMNIWDMNLTGGSNHAVYATSGGQLTNSSSSLRYKTNTETLADCSWLYSLRPVSFDWKDEVRAKAEGRQIGFIAEEVYAVNPQLAWTNVDGQVEGVHYEKFCVPVIAELQKLRAEVDELKAKLTAA